MANRSKKNKEELAIKVKAEEVIPVMHKRRMRGKKVNSEEQIKPIIPIEYLSEKEIIEGTRNMTHQEILFCKSFLTHLNMKRASLEAGYEQHSSIGSMVYNRPHIKKFLEEMLRNVLMTDIETDTRLATIARGDVGAFYDIDEDDSSQITLNFKKADKAGVMFLIKKITPTRWGLVVEFHDPLQAIQLIERIKGRIGNDVIAVGNLQNNPFAKMKELTQGTDAKPE